MLICSPMKETGSYSSGAIAWWGGIHNGQVQLRGWRRWGSYEWVIMSSFDCASYQVLTGCLVGQIWGQRGHNAHLLSALFFWSGSEPTVSHSPVASKVKGYVICQSPHLAKLAGTFIDEVQWALARLLPSTGHHQNQRPCVICCKSQIPSKSKTMCNLLWNQIPERAPWC